MTHGYSNIEAFTAGAIVLFVAFVLVAAGGPSEELRMERDEVRQEGVRDIMEVMLDLQLSDYESFSGIVGRVTDRRVMIGSGVDCSGGFGSACADASLTDACLDISGFFDGHDIDEPPVDPDGSVFDAEKTGYYLSYLDGVLGVGSCNPEYSSEISLETRLSWE
jgi:hypothetical protein